MEYPPIFWVKQIYYPVLAAVGVPVNLVAIVILSRGRCGLSKCITRYLMAMSTADLLVVIVEVIIRRINFMYLSLNFLFLTRVCSINFVAYIIAVDCSVWFTVAFTFDRFVAICCQKLQLKYCTEKTASVIIAVVIISSCLRTVPFHFLHKPLVIINNVGWGCVGARHFVTSPMWRAYEWIDSIITPLSPILFISLCNALTVRHIIAANKVRKQFRNNAENSKDDAEEKNRKKSMILLFTISANFMLLWIIYVVHSLNWPVTPLFSQNRFLNDPVYIAQEVGFMLQILSTCTNTCIYGLTQRKFGEELRNGVKYIFTLNGKMCKL